MLSGQEVVQFGGDVGGDGLGPQRGERVADLALLDAGPPGEPEVVAEALDPGGLAEGEGAVEAVVEEPAAARVVEVGGDSASESVAVQPGAGL